MPQEITFGLLVLAVLIIVFLLGKKTSKSSSTTAETLQLLAEKEFLTQQNQQLQQEKHKLEEQTELVRQDNQELIARISIRETEIANFKEKLEVQQKQTLALQEQFTTQFENLANKILEEKSDKFTQLNKVQMETILTPLQEKIGLFEQKVEQTHKESIDHHAALRQQIFGLQQVHAKMSEETLNLTKALKGDNKMQGNWGEMILESVLEKSGLEKDREYKTQQSYTSDNGNRLQPDVVIYLPDHRHLVVDSKVSLVAYEQYINTTEKQEQNRYLQEHILSIKRHIENLSDKNYYELYKGTSPDFVLLFIPIETAFSIAINADNTLYTKAFEKNIVIVTPSTLLATLRTVETIWRQQKQQENAYEIARQAGLLHDKFVGLINDLTKIGRKLDETRNEYDSAFNKLSLGKGNLLTSVQKLKDMGAKTKKTIDPDLLQE
ncbi:DNA recombination protein RmuC [Myroides sp. 1354]|uniref:DNA recombination protein RmuC n=1 Tax=unclassified Myroides TaxID=2642485 RepID=UPI0025779694|nr:MULTISPECIES: DNA recombination protein RmuC [unclassified Myroides]MDM1045236.1 DNA recombination protein RmuC [Myroides sp. R163-1]MDM1056118.1 DNA recombination protein RmuC [Myroides sp. 1354]MDM1069247.1 DNA recombination protein RmuC [Myroides sp. 1372]